MIGLTRVLLGRYRLAVRGGHNGPSRSSSILVGPPSPTHRAWTMRRNFVFNTFSFLVWGALVMWMCAGFTMLESGAVRTKNASMICLKKHRPVLHRRARLFLHRLQPDVRRRRRRDRHLQVPLWSFGQRGSPRYWGGGRQPPPQFWKKAPATR